MELINYYISWKCKKGNEIQYSKNDNGQLHIECINPTDKLHCDNYRKGLLYSTKEMMKKLGISEDK